MKRSRSRWAAACSPRPGSSRSRDGAFAAAKLGQSGEKGEEPGKALRALAEVEGDAVTFVANAHVDEGGAADAIAVEVDVEVDGERRVLTPVAEHFLRDLVGRRFQRRLAGVVVPGVEVREIDVGEAQQGERSALARTECAFVTAPAAALRKGARS